MTATNPTSITIRDLEVKDFAKVEALEKQIWGLSDRDVFPVAASIASKAAGNIWVGAFDGDTLAGFAFGFFAVEQGELTVHSHMLGVDDRYRDSDLGYKLKLAQRQRVIAIRVRAPRQELVRVNIMSWTFDPLQSRNAHLNFAKLGVVSDSYRVDFYGTETSSMLHRNGTDRLWVKWPMMSRRVEGRLGGKENRAEMLDALSNLVPLIHFNGEGKPVRANLEASLQRQRIAIEIPSDIVGVEKKDAGLAREWRAATRWAFTEALKAGFVVAEFCRTVRGQQGPGAYLLEKSNLEQLVPELAH